MSLRSHLGRNVAHEEIVPNRPEATTNFGRTIVGVLASHWPQDLVVAVFNGQPKGMDIARMVASERIRLNKEGAEGAPGNI